MDRQNLSALPYLLPQLTANYATRFLDTEASALESIIIGITQEIQTRKLLKTQILNELTARELELDSALMNLPSAYDRITLDQKLALEQRLERNDLEKISIRETTFRDTIELKKLYWHYWLMLQRKRAQRDFLP